MAVFVFLPRWFHLWERIKLANSNTTVDDGSDNMEKAGTTVVTRGQMPARIPVPVGYRMGSVACGIKLSQKRDVTLLVSDRAATAVGVFTSNRVCAAPVRASRGRLPSRDIRAIVVNSGNANACTGPQGELDAEQMTAILGERLGCPAAQVLVASTGIIGHPLPMSKVRAGIDGAFQNLGSDADHVHLAAQGIMTTDTYPKIAFREISLPTGNARVLGLAKGAAMIGPNMATMLAFVLTDVVADPALLDGLLRHAVDESFHCVSVEGHTSTNDSVYLLANGGSGASLGDARTQMAFAEAVTDVCSALAQEIADDAEGASHVVTIDVTGTARAEDARRIAKAIANSALVKTALCGNDPNWGRVVSAAGYAGVAFAEADVSLRINGHLLYDRGTPLPFDKAAVSAHMAQQRAIHIDLQFTLGSERCRFWTCDLTAEYVRINSEYTT